MATSCSDKDSGCTALELSLNDQELLEGYDPADLDEVLLNGRVFCASTKSVDAKTDSHLNLECCPEPSITSPSCVLGVLCQDSNCTDLHPNSPPPNKPK